MSKKQTTYYRNGQLQTEAWINEAGQYHRLDGPAYRGWSIDGLLQCEEWWLNDQFHRLDGPAVRGWTTEDGQVWFEEWYINGVEYETEAEFQVAVDLYKANEIAGLF